MNLGEYLEPVFAILGTDEQRTWFKRLEEKAKAGLALYDTSDERVRQGIWEAFWSKSRTEEVKAWYSEPEQESLFQGTSISSLTIPFVTPDPLPLNSVFELEEEIASAYVERHDALVDRVRGAFQENVDVWVSQGLFYGVCVCSKVLSQVFGLSISYKDVVFDVDGHHVDPHEITSYPQSVRESYFEKCIERIECFQGLTMERKELESSLVLADISKPKIARYKNEILLAPIRCNDIAAVLSGRVIEKIVEKTSGRIRPKSLAVVIYDTDTPYTYHDIMGYGVGNLAPVLPGLTVLGTSGTIDAFRWLYTYRVSLISQKIQKGSVYSEVQRRFMPFVFFGVLVWRDAEILLDMDNLSRLRYRGNLAPDLEFAYLIQDLHEMGTRGRSTISWEHFRESHSSCKE